MGRPAYHRTGSGTSGIGDSAVVTTTFDAEGNPTAVKRSASRAPATLTTYYSYDKANRKITETAPDGAVDSVMYDKAGNVIRTVTRRGNVITASYDALNRRLSRVVPSVSYDSVTQGIALLTASGDTNNPAYPRYPNASGRTYVVPADTSSFTYDVVGHLLTAKNSNARVTRSYTTYGALASEEQKIMTWAGNGADSSFAHHDYTLQYSYDFDGRRVSIQHPSQLLPRDTLRTVYSTTSYAYDSGYRSIDFGHGPFRTDAYICLLTAGRSHYHDPRDGLRRVISERRRLADLHLGWIGVCQIDGISDRIKHVRPHVQDDGVL